MRKVILSIIILSVNTILFAQANYHVSVADKHRIVTGSQVFQKSDNVILANALLWGIERGGQFKDLIVDCDYEKKRFTMDYNIIREGESSFSAKLTIQVDQGRLVYLINEIKGQTPGLSGMLGLINFDKMNPEKKPKQKAMIEDFEKINQKELNSLLSYVEGRETNVDFWPSIINNRIEKGMNTDDVLLILGKPVDIQRSGETVQYMYNSFTYVFFENGKVKSFMQ